MIKKETEIKTEDTKFAIFKTGGKQYRAVEGWTLDIEKHPQADQKTITLDEVLLVSDAGNTHIGQPFLESASIVADVVIEEGKADKILVFKFKKKTGYKKTQGHRQRFTRIKIKSINLKKTTAAKKETAEVTPKTAKKTKKE